MAFGLTPVGFSKKRLENIKLEIEASLKTSFGSGINLLPQSVLGQIVGIMSERESLIWELAEQVYNSQYPDTASGVQLDNVVSITGINRLPATFSTATLRVFGTLGATVPAGFTASSNGNPFIVSNSGVIGTGIDEIQSIVFSAVPTLGTWSLNFNGQITAALPFNATTTTIATALNALSNLSGVTVVGSYAIGFNVTLPGQSDLPLLVVQTNSTATTINITESQKGYGPFADVTARAVNIGNVIGPARSIVTIDTPTFGITGVTNLLDAVVGRNVETDSELRLRRQLNQQRQGTATVEGIRSALRAVNQVTQALVVENVTLATVGGIPAKSFESFVVGGTPQDIGNAIWKVKPAGIQAHGSQSVTVIDSQGFNQVVKFSRPTVQAIYIIATIAKNTNPTEGELYPINGNNLVRDALLAYGQTLTLGKDVVTNLLFSPINAVPGVIGIDLKIGFSPSPTASVNLSIGPTEIAQFDSSRITVI
jgi:uncharacterized phage protein gp47/JayE